MRTRKLNSGRNFKCWVNRMAVLTTIPEYHDLGRLHTKVFILCE